MTEKRLCLVDGCDRPMPTGDQSTACPRCWDRLDRALGEVPWIAQELDTMLARQAVTGERNGGRSAEKPLPIDVRASEAVARLTELLGSWVRLIVEESPAPPRLTGDRVPLPALSVVLMRYEGFLQAHPAGHEAISEIVLAVRKARQAIDLAPEKDYAGPCGHVDEASGAKCSQELYARRGDAIVRCRTCGTDHDVEGLRAALTTAAEDLLVTTREACGAVRTYTSGHLTPELIRKWKQRGRIVARGHDKQGRDLWRLGDLTELATAIDREAR